MEKQEIIPQFLFYAVRIKKYSVGGEKGDRFLLENVHRYH